VARGACRLPLAREIRGRGRQGPSGRAGGAHSWHEIHPAGWGARAMRTRARGRKFRERMKFSRRMRDGGFWNRPERGARPARGLHRNQRRVSAAAPQGGDGRPREKGDGSETAVERGDGGDTHGGGDHSDVKEGGRGGVRASTWRGGGVSVVLPILTATRATETRIGQCAGGSGSLWPTHRFLLPLRWVSHSALPLLPAPPLGSPAPHRREEPAHRAVTRDNAPETIARDTYEARREAVRRGEGSMSQSQGPASPGRTKEER